MLSSLLSLWLMIECLKSETMCDVSVTIIGDTLYCGSPQTVVGRLEL